jgi:hypothetical protein
VSGVSAKAWQRAFEPSGERSIDEIAIATPAISDRLLIIHGMKHLIGVAKVAK